MSLRRTITSALVASSLVSAPVLAQADAVDVQRTSAPVEDENNLRGGFIIPLIALIAIILGLCVATDQCGIGDDDDLPHSP